ncbi:MAG: DUF2523 family protein [Lysobacteraceae bacterium]
MSKIGNIFDVFIPKLWAGLQIAIAGIVGRCLATLGLSLVTFNGVLPSLKAFLLDFVALLPPSALQMLSAIGFDIAATMILSALSVRMAWKVFIIPKVVADSLEGI